MKGDGFYWNERGPQSPLGALWYRALVMVGRADVDGRYRKIAAVSTELRESLKKCRMHKQRSAEQKGPNFPAHYPRKKGCGPRACRPPPHHRRFHFA